MDITSILNRLPAALEIPTFQEMRLRTNQLGGCKRTQIRQIGEDRFGEPIDMISIGEGDRSILIIGAPHPNEPIGCVGIEWLIECLRQDDLFRTRSGLAWHFIKAIEPYALMQNEGWFKRPDPAIYLEHFYRPAFRHQAEYGFPLDHAGVEPVATTPENQAYRRAIKLAAPDLLVSLHGADCGGAFYFLSRADEELARSLSSQPGKRGIPLNEMGEGAFGFDDVVLAPGVFMSARSAPGQKHQLGSIDEFLASASPSTMTLVPEVPLFEDRQAVTDVALEPNPENCAAQHWGEQVVELLEPFVTRLAEDATVLETLYVEAILENLEWADEISPSPPWESVTPGSEFARQLRLCRLVGLRPVAMARRLASMRRGRARSAGVGQLAAAAEDATSAYLRTALADPLMHNQLTPTPLPLAVANQLEAILTAARPGRP